MIEDLVAIVELVRANLHIRPEIKDQLIEIVNTEIRTVVGVPEAIGTAEVVQSVATVEGS